MTEQTWLECEDPQPLLEFLRGKASSRKLRLFAAACRRHIETMLTDERSRNAVRMAELYADDQCSSADLQLAHGIADYVASCAETADGSSSAAGGPVWATDGDAILAAVGSAMGAAVARGARTTFALGSTTEDRTDIWDDAAGAERAAQADLLREIFGNPFRPSTPLSAACFTPPVRALSERAYKEIAFGLLPGIADILENHGCTEPGLLSHLRGPGPHVRGCWAVDLLTCRA